MRNNNNNNTNYRRHVVIMFRDYWTSTTGMVASPARGQLKRRENNFLVSPCVPENLGSPEDGFGRPVPRQPAFVLHTQVESGAYSRVPLPTGPAFHDDGVRSIHRSMSCRLTIIILILIENSGRIQGLTSINIVRAIE